MPTFKEKLANAFRIYPSDYFCLEFSEKNTDEELNDGMSLFQDKEVQFLDITFNDSLKTEVDYLRKVLHLIIPKLKGTKITRVDLSCNSLHQMGLEGIKELLALMPDNVEQVVLSGNEWGRLAIEPESFLEQLRSVTKKEVLFEGTNTFERRLIQIQQQQKANSSPSSSVLERNRLFNGKEESTFSAGQPSKGLTAFS